MQLRGGGANVRPLRHQPRRQADRDVARQRDRVQRQRRQLQLRRRAAQVGGQLVAGGGQACAQRRQGRLGGGQLAARGQRGGQRGRADLLLALGDAYAVALAVGDRLGGAHLLAQRGLLQRGGDHVGGESQPGGVGLRLLHVGQRRLRLDAAAGAAEQVDAVADADAGVVHGQRREGERVAERGAGLLLAGDAGIRIHRRKAHRAGGAGVLLRLAQGGLGRGQRRAVAQGGVHPAVEFGIAEHGPPVLGHCRVDDETLCRAGHAGGAGGQRLRGIAVHRRRLRTVVVRADRAAGEDQPQQRWQCAQAQGRREAEQVAGHGGKPGQGKPGRDISRRRSSDI